MALGHPDGIACVPCNRDHKKKCDRMLPCESCQTRDIDCHYANKKKRKRPSHNHALSQAPQPAAVMVADVHDPTQVDTIHVKNKKPKTSSPVDDDESTDAQPMADLDKFKHSDFKLLRRWWSHTIRVLYSNESRAQTVRDILDDYIEQSSTVMHAIMSMACRELAKESTDANAAKQFKDEAREHSKFVFALLAQDETRAKIDSELGFVEHLLTLLCVLMNGPLKEDWLTYCEDDLDDDDENKGRSICNFICGQLNQVEPEVQDHVLESQFGHASRLCPQEPRPWQHEIVYSESSLSDGIHDSMDLDGAESASDEAQNEVGGPEDYFKHQNQKFEFEASSDDENGFHVKEGQQKQKLESSTASDAEKLESRVGIEGFFAKLKELRERLFETIPNTPPIWALDALIHCYEDACANMNEHGNVSLLLPLRWLWDKNLEFWELLSEKDEAALIVFAHYAVLLRTQSHHWYMVRWPRRILIGVERAVGEEWSDDLAWCRQRVGMNQVKQSAEPEICGVLGTQ